MTWRRFEAAAAGALAVAGADGVRAIADGVASGLARGAILGLRQSPEYAECAAHVLDAWQSEDVPEAEASAYLRGLAVGYAQRAGEQDVSVVWSGPSSHRVPVRATARVLISLIDEAERELLLMTYSARPYKPLTEALAAAVARGVSVGVVVETLQGAGSALAGVEPASAFQSIPGVVIWHWPPGHRTEAGAKMHAKLAVADRRLLLTTSANLTQSGVNTNIEAGTLIRGGSAPARAAEHIRELQRSGALRRYT